MTNSSAVKKLLRQRKNKIDTICAICTGAIFSLISIEIIPEALEIGGWFVTITGLSLGIVSFELLHNRFHNHQRWEDPSRKKVYIRTGLLLMISVAIHNLPMGIALGVNQDDQLTLTLLQTLFLHSIPEGIILFTPLFLPVSLFGKYRG